MTEPVPVLSMRRTAEHGREFVRLDCVAGDAAPRRRYESPGMQHRGDARMRGAPGRRADEGPVTVVSRYQGDAALLGRARRNPAGPDQA
ncbi:hypothetical protein GCM10023225_10240 [Kineococcus glutinatus]|uniref:Uncharacterized protein n=1 Tax=Kineococcus glutinatus TaxID=1070872 RepID=A0ABP9HGS6_9ACTN